MSVDSTAGGDGVGGNIDLMAGHSTAAPMSGQDSAHKHRNSDVVGGLGFSSVGQSTEKGPSTLPDVHPNSSKSGNNMPPGYQTH